MIHLCDKTPDAAACLLGMNLLRLLPHQMYLPMSVSLYHTLGLESGLNSNGSTLILKMS